MNDQLEILSKLKRRSTVGTDRLPPHSIEAEQGCLGAIMLFPNENLAECQEKFESEEVFYDTRHQAIYRTLVEMSGTPIDLITLQQKLKDKNQLDAVGGFGYLVSLPDKAGMAGHLGSYTQILHEKYLLRKMIQLCSETMARAYEQDGEVESLISQFEGEALQINHRSEVGECDVRTLTGKAINQIQDEFENPDKMFGISTGFRDIDRMTGGMKPEEMIVLAARPSVGKSALMMNIAEHVTIEQGLPVGVFSLEMSGLALGRRALLSRARTGVKGMTEDALPRLLMSSNKIGNSKLHICDKSDLTIGRIRAQARRMYQRHGIKLFIIDYLQCIKGNPKLEKVAAVEEISNGIKAMAKELHVPVIAVAQFNRENEKESRAPRLSDLKWSGAIEQDADLALLLHRDIMCADDVQKTDVIIAKQRNGPTGKIDLTFFKKWTRFENAAPAYEP